MLLNRRSLGNRGYGGYGLGGNSVGLLGSRGRGLGLGFGGGLGGGLGGLGGIGGLGFGGRGPLGRGLGGGLLGGGTIGALGGTRGYGGLLGGGGSILGTGHLGPFNGIPGPNDYSPVLSPLGRLPRNPAILLPGAATIPGCDLCEGCIQRLQFGDYDIGPPCSCGNAHELFPNGSGGAYDPYVNDYA